MADTVAHMPESRVTLPAPAATRTRAAAVWSLAVWALAAIALVALDGRVDLANLGMLLVLASALSALWLPLPLTVLVSGLALLAFNWCFVPPRGSFTIDLQQHALLLGAMLALNLIIALLVTRLRAQAAGAKHHARQALQLRAWGDQLRDLAEPHAMAEALHAQLHSLLDPEAPRGTVAALSSLRLRDGLPDANDEAAADWLGTPDADGREGLWLTVRQSRAMGPGTGWHDAQAAWYLPWRDGHGSRGATRLPLPPGRPVNDALRAHAQALCDQLGGTLAHLHANQAAQRASEQAQAQAVRNALLAAISHDHRTPLATILGAATSLIEQADRLAPEQRLRLAGTIRDQASQLSRLTDNTLQLARLDAPGVSLRLDWESPEDIIGAAMNRVRQRDPSGATPRRVRARLEPGLPLLRCDAVLLAQLLDNLIDNALAYSPSDTPVELLARRQGEHLVLAVRDRGPGIPPAWREKVFQVFQRGEPAAAPDGRAGRRGAGVGLAVCRAIARAHGGELRLRPRAHGGSSFECALPVGETPPAAPPAETG